jgi:hypothetical protein
MTYSHSSSTGPLAAVAALLVLMMLLVLGVVGAGFLWVTTANAPVMAVPTPGAVPAPRGPAAPANASYQVRAKSAQRLPSGECQVVLALSQVGAGSMEQFTLRVSTVDGSACQILSPALAAPFPPQADVVVRVPQTAADKTPLRLSVSTTVNGRQGYLGTYGSSQSTTLLVPAPAGEEPDAKTAESTAPPVAATPE